MPLTITKEMMEADPFFKKGIREGKLEAQKETVLNLHRKLNLPPEKIVEVLKVSEGFVIESLSLAFLPPFSVNYSNRILIISI